MIALSPERFAEVMGARITRRGGSGFPALAAIDSRAITGGELFFGLKGESDDGGRFARVALESGAWGVVVGPGYADVISGPGDAAPEGWVFVVEDPLAAMQSLATAWRRELASTVIGITGSVGKTSVKDITKAILPGAVHASEENFNTEIGLPLTILSAPEGTDTLVLEMAMRGRGQIAELAAIAEPDIGVITIVGPVHLELLGSIEAIAATKAELFKSLAPGSPAVAPMEAGHLEPHLEGMPGLIRFGPGVDGLVDQPQNELALFGAHTLAGNRQTVDIDGVEQGTPDIVLALVVSTVADPYRFRPLVPAQVVVGAFGEVVLTTDPVHDL